MPPPPMQEVPANPTNGLLIDLLEAAQDVCSSNPALCLRNVLTQWYQELYPTSQTITRPSRFEAAVRRIAAPVKSSIRGASRMTEEEVTAYRQREWAPKPGRPKGNSEGKVKLVSNIK